MKFNIGHLIGFLLVPLGLGACIVAKYYPVVNDILFWSVGMGVSFVCCLGLAHIGGQVWKDIWLKR